MITHVGESGERIQDEFVPLLSFTETQETESSWDKQAVQTQADGTGDSGSVYAQDDGQTEQSAVTLAEGATDAGTNTDQDVTDATATDAVTAVAVHALTVPEAITYSMEQLSDRNFLVGNCYTIDSSTNVTDEELNAETLLGKDLHIDNSTGEYKVLIYHTHGSEAFADSREGVTEDTVIGVGDELARILQEDYGIAVYHDRTVYDVIDGVEDRSLAYDLASDGVDAILEQYPSIEVVLDIHRDGVREDVRLVREIDGVPTAQIMFLNGVSRTNENGDIDYLSNPYKVDNLAFSLQMHLAGKAMYGDLMRNIYVRGYCYNLNKMARSSLIEVGAQTNTVAEAKNSMTALGAILYKVLIAE